MLRDAVGAAPPVPIDEILGKIADIEEDDIPGGLDAVVMARTRKRPRVILSRALIPNRRRFTLAHELAHIRLPWQLGSAFCHTSVMYVAGEALAKQVEDDANDFAAEFLLPSDWLSTRLSEDLRSAASSLLDCAEMAQVSPQVVALACAHVAFPICVEVVQGEKMFCRKSANCHIKAESPWDAKLVRDAREAGGIYSETLAGAYKVRVIAFNSEAPAVLSAGLTARSPEDLLAEMLLSLPEPSRKKFAQRLSGVVGSATRHVQASRSEEQIASVLMQTFVGRDEAYAWFATHPLFPKFVRSKARVLAERRK